MQRFIPIFLAVLLAGCTQLQRLKALDPQANDFASSLAAEYLAYADSERELGDGRSADLFAGKGLEAAHGKPPPPESPDAWQIVRWRRVGLGEARENLVALLRDDLQRVAPQKAARAQLLYDCWVHQAATGEDSQLMSCSEEFGSALQELQTVSGLFGRGGTESPHEE